MRLAEVLQFLGTAQRLQHRRHQFLQFNSILYIVINIAICQILVLVAAVGTHREDFVLGHILFERHLVAGHFAVGAFRVGALFVVEPPVDLVVEVSDERGFVRRIIKHDRVVEGLVDFAHEEVAASGIVHALHGEIRFHGTGKTDRILHQGRFVDVPKAAYHLGTVGRIELGDFDEGLGFLTVHSAPFFERRQFKTPLELPKDKRFIPNRRKARFKNYFI